MQFRFANESDFPSLAVLNRELLAIDGQENLFSDSELNARFVRWMAEGHRVLLFAVNEEIVGYALYAIKEDAKERLVYLRHFVVKQGERRKGYGREAFRHLQEEVWPRDARIAVETRENNAAAIGFWKSVGFRIFSSVYVLDGTK